MPTFLGPTNMPLLEAAALGCPVLCSDLKGHREMMGNTAIYFDPQEEESILKALEKIYHIENREEWIGTALKHIKSSSFNLSDCLKQLDKALLTLVPIRNNWP